MSVTKTRPRWARAWLRWCGAAAVGAVLAAMTPVKGWAQGPTPESEPSREAARLQSEAGELHRQGGLDAAIALEERALSICEENLGPEHPDVAASLHNLAGMHWEKGGYARAEALQQRALAIREKTLGIEHPDVAASLLQLGEVYRARGDYGKAEPLYERALAMFVKLLGAEHPHVAISLHHLAELYCAKGDYAKAETCYRRALEIAEKALGPEHHVVGMVLNGLAVLYTWREDDAKAEPLYKRALALQEKALGPENPHVAAPLNNLAALYRIKGDYATAEAFYRRALAIQEKGLRPEHRHVATLLNNFAVLYERKGDIPGAVRIKERAAAIEDRNSSILLNTGSEEQKRAYMDTLRGATSRTISLHVQLAPKSRDAKQLALTTVLRRKGRVLDAMTDSFATLRRRSTPADRELFDDLRSTSAQYSALVWQGSDKIPLDQYRTTLEKLDEKRQEIEAALSRRSAEHQAELRPIALDRVQAAIPEGAVLVEIFRYHPYHPKAALRAERWGSPRYVAYVLHRRGEASFADLGEAAAIEVAVQRLRAALSDPDLTHDPTPAARALDGLVMQPVRKLLGDTRWVFLSPDGALNLVPFAALMDENGDYLVQRYLLTYLASGRDLLRMHGSVQPSHGALVLADPMFDRAEAHGANSEQDRGLRSIDMSLIRFSPLPSTVKEARAIEQRLPATQVLLGAQATEGAIKGARGPRILHIATHGFFLSEGEDGKEASVKAGLLAPSHNGMAGAAQGENPLLRSGLGLAGANARASGAKDDGILTALEVSGLDLVGTRLVVLSACETGVGAAISGEGVYGLRRSFAIAGAETQVMSLWKVDSGVTREMMLAYYDKLDKGAGRSEAMRHVQLEMLAQNGRSHPNLWASFIVSGNPAALDGSTVAPNFVQVTPGMRGCACRQAGHKGEPGGASALGLVGLAVLAAAGRSHKHGRVRLCARSIAGRTG